MRNVKTKIDAKITVDPTLDKRYGDGSLFPRKIERVKDLLKGTKFDKAASANSSPASA